MGKGSVIIIGPAYPLRGGLAGYNERLARAFLEEGYEVVIYTFSLQYPGFLFPGKTQYSDGPPPEGLDIRVRINSVNPLNWIRWGNRIRKERPDMVIMKFWLPFMAPCLGSLARIIRRNKHSRIYSILDNVIPHEPHFFDYPLIRYFIRAVDGFVGMSASVLEDLNKFTTRKPRAFCPHPLYDHFGKKIPRDEALRILQLDKEYSYLLFFGFIREYKGLDLLLRAFAICRSRQEGLRVLVAGEYYTDPGPIQKIIRECQLEKELILHTDFIPDDKVAAYFCAANLVVQPYKSATQSGVTQIAYHFDKPMIVTRVGGLTEMVNDKLGYLVEPEPGSIARAIDDYFSRQREGEMSKEVAGEKHKYSWERMIRTIESLHATKP